MLQCLSMAGRPTLLVVLAVVVGVALGLGSFTFVYARGSSYLTNDPAACANCHIMREHFDAWRKSAIAPWPSATTATHRRA